MYTSYKNFKEIHSGVYICKVLQEVLSDYNIKTDITK
jgi:hypothetical protein